MLHHSSGVMHYSNTMLISQTIRGQRGLNSRQMEGIKYVYDGYQKSGPGVRLYVLQILALDGDGN